MLRDVYGRSRSLFVLLALLMMHACVDTARTERGPAGSAPPSRPPRASRFALEEWGVLLVGLGEQNAAARTVGPSHVAPARVSSSTTTPRRRPSASFGAVAMKPVLYLRALDGALPAAIDIEIASPGGEIVEHWPATSGDIARRRWRVLAAEDETPVYPTDRASACASVHDGICEAIELGRYVDRKASRFKASGTSTDFLFYRATLPVNPTFAPSLRAERERRVEYGERGSVVSNPFDPGAPPTRLRRRVESTYVVTRYALQIPTRADGAIRGPVWLVERAGNDVFVWRFDVRGIESERFALGRETESTIERAIADIRTLLHERGLSAEVATIMLDAWTEGLFGAASVGATDALAPPRFSLIFLATPEEIDARLPLRVTPAPERVARALLVRQAITLDR